MLKRSLVSLFCVLALTLSVSAQTELKLAHINSQEFMQLLPETKEAIKKLQDLSQKYDSELSKIQDDFQKKYTEYVSQADTLPPAIKARRTQEVSELQQTLANFREQAAQSIEEQQRELLVPIQEKVFKAINEIAEQQGILYVFDTAVLVYYKPTEKSIDLKPLLMKKFNLN